MGRRAAATLVPAAQSAGESAAAAAAQAALSRGSAAAEFLPWRPSQETDLTKCVSFCRERLADHLCPIVVIRCSSRGVDLPGVECWRVSLLSCFLFVLFRKVPC